MRVEIFEYRLEIYPPEMELKIEHERTHATFLDPDISIVVDRFVYKLYGKCDNFNFFIVRMSQMSSNIPGADPDYCNVSKRCS